MASGDQFVQLAIEAAPNGESGANAVSTTVFYHPNRNFQLAATPILDDRTDEFRGTAEPVPPDVMGWNAPEGSTSGRLYANVLGAYYFMLLGAPTTTAGNGVITDPDSVVIPTGATRHVWNSSTLDPATIRSAQMIFFYGNNTAYWLKARGVTATGLTLNLGARGEPSTFEASLSGLYLTKIADPTLTPTYDALTVKPMNRGNFSIPTWAASASTPIDATFTFENPVEQDDILSTSDWPVAWTRPNQAGAVPRLSGTYTARSVATADHDTFVNNSVFSYGAKWVSSQNIGATTYKYSQWISGAATYTNYNRDVLEHKLRHQAPIEWQAGKSGATPAFTITLVNGVASYSSVS